MGRLLDSIEEKRAVLLAAKEGAERTRKDARKVGSCPAVVAVGGGDRGDRRGGGLGGFGFLLGVVFQYRPLFRFALSLAPSLPYGRPQKNDDLTTKVAFSSRFPLARPRSGCVSSSVWNDVPCLLFFFLVPRQLEARLTEERAELVASNGLLDQNERLRAAIVAEEREKFESEKVRLCHAGLRSMSTRVWCDEARDQVGLLCGDPQTAIIAYT